MATNDKQLIDAMKETITYQSNMIVKREKLVLAITHNIKYLAGIHETNNRALQIAMERLLATEK